MIESGTKRIGWFRRLFKNPAKVLAGLSIASFACALVLPSMSARGYCCLLCGLNGLLWPFDTYGLRIEEVVLWCSNLWLIWSWIRVLRGRSIRFMEVVGVLGFTVLECYWFMKYEDCRPEIGAYVWLASLALAGVAGWAVRSKSSAVSVESREGGS